MAFKRFDDTLVQGDKYWYEDKGYITVGARTRRFAVTSTRDMGMAGYVKFFAQSRQYIFFPLNCLLDKDSLREIADFCVEVTAAHREKRKPFLASE